MLRVTVEILPGGGRRGQKTLAVLSIANITDLAPVSDYQVVVDGEQVAILHEHERARGFWPLVQRAVNAAAAVLSKPPRK